MEAGKKNLYSSININFGDKVQDPTPFKLKFDIHLVSEKTQNLRFNVSQYTGKQIPQNSFLFQIQTKQDGQVLGQKIKQKVQTTENIKNMKQDGIKFDVFTKGNKVYIVIYGSKFQIQFQNLSSIKDQFNIQKAIDQVLQIQIKSKNRLDKVKQILINQDKTRAFLDSLKCSIKFKLTQQLNNILQSIMGQAFMNSPINAGHILNSFENFNLSIKCQSSKFLQNNQAYIKLIQEIPKINFNQQFQNIKNMIGNQIKFYFFNSAVSATAQLVAQDIHFILDLLFA